MHPAVASQSKLCELGSLVLTSMVGDHGQGEKQRVERRRRSAHQSPRCIPGRHGGTVPAWPTRRDRGKTSPWHHREHHNRRFHRRAHTHTHTHTHTQRSPRRSTTGVREEANEVSRSVANLMQNPERDPALDLLEEEVANGTVQWRWKGMLRRVFHPRWQR
jgi:hypothetical protein